MKISVVTVAYKSHDILKKSIESFFKYNDMGKEIEYILVDNSPIAERVDKYLPKNILENIIYIPANNKGFGAGNNLGSLYASGEILAFINPDIIFVEPIFTKIYEQFVADRTIALVGCKLLYEDLSPGFSFYYDYKYSIIKKWTLKLWNKLNYFNADSMYIAGADLFIRKNVFLECGKFDEKIFMYYEEPDIIRRIKEIGNWKILFDKRLQMIHLEKKSTPNTLNSVKYEFDSAIYYGKKYNLNYKRKIKFEYEYYKLKKMIYSIICKNKADAMERIIEFIKNNYEKYF